MAASRDGKILTWNTIAEKIYGRAWDEMHDKSIDEIYEEPSDYKNFLEDVQSRYSVREKILKVRHPQKGIRYISTSTTVLYDGHHNYQGVLSLGRDVTTLKRMERKFHRTRYWVAFSILLLFLSMGTIFFGYSHFSRDPQTVSIKQEGLRNQLGKDYLLLKSLLIDHFLTPESEKAKAIVKDFFNIQTPGEIPYKGLLFLDRDKMVMDYYPVDESIDVTSMINRSYAGINFHNDENPLYSILTLYHTDKNHPMGEKGVEVAFEMKKEGNPMGWLVFQMNMSLLRKKYGIDEEGLKEFLFNNRKL